MEKSLKYYLSIICLVSFFSCKNEVSNLYTTQNIELAEKTYQDAIQFRQGSTAFQNGIADAIKINPKYDEAVNELSVAYLKRGLPHKWKPQFDKAVKLNPKEWIPWRGYLYLWFYRDYKKAIADFDTSDTLTPNFIDAPQGHSVDYWRGIAYLGLKDHTESIRYFDKYIAKEIEESGEDWVEVTAFLYKGVAYYEIGKYDKALVAFNKQLQYSRNLSADAKYYKALIFKDQKKNEAAKTTLDSAIEDFNSGYFNSRAYVETLRQIYRQDLENLKIELNQ